MDSESAGSGAARKAADALKRRKERNKEAMCEAERAMGIKSAACDMSKQHADRANSR